MCLLGHDTRAEGAEIPTLPPTQTATFSLLIDVNRTANYRHDYVPPKKLIASFRGAKHQVTSPNQEVRPTPESDLEDVVLYEVDLTGDD